MTGWNFSRNRNEKLSANSDK